MERHRTREEVTKDPSGAGTGRGTLTCGPARGGSIMCGEAPYRVRIWRRLHPGGNPLARTSDRLEALLLIAVLLGTLLALPIAAAVGSDAYGQRAALSAQQ